MNRKTFALYLAGVFVAALIFTPLFAGWFANSQNSKGYEQTLISNTPYKTSYEIVYDSHGTKIYALFTIPKAAGKVPVFVIAPAVSITKESEQNHLGDALNELGYATFILDTRGQGETGGTVPSLAHDFFTHMSGQYPVQYMMVDDIFRAHEIVSGREEIDADRIFVAGESAGGRHAMIAAGVQQNFSGALIISSSGYFFNETNQDQKLVGFMRSIDPVSYLALLPPRKIAFAHGIEDAIIPIEQGRMLYEVASEPKKLYEVAGGHSFESITNTTFLTEAVAWLAS